MRAKRVHASRWAVLAVIVLGVVSACGVPNSGGPIADRTIVPDRGVSCGETQASLAPATASTAVELVNAYLSSVQTATNMDDQLAAARAFMTEPTAKDFKPNGPVFVVRPIDQNLKDTFIGSSSDEVTGTFQVVGEFSVGTGELEPPQQTQQQITLRFTTTINPDSRQPGPLRLSEVPPFMVMSEHAFQTSFAPHPIYFWDNAHRALIPDLRYLSLSPCLPSKLQATNIVKWVLGIPPPDAWISPAVDLLVNTNLQGPNIGVTANTYVVNLQATATTITDFAPLAYQLRWSLGDLLADPTSDDVPSPLEIQIDGQRQVLSSSDEYAMRVENLAASNSTEQAATFAIAGGRVIATTVDTSAKIVTEPRQPDILNSAKNANVVLGAVNNTETAAAIVRADASNRQSLWIRRLNAPNPTEFVMVDGLPVGTISRPQFIVDPRDAVIVAVKGKLFLIDQANQAHALSLPSGVNVSAFAVAADGHRIAYVSNGALYLSTITDTQVVTPGRPIGLGFLTPEVTISKAIAVSWSSVDQLIVVGTNQSSRYAAAEINVDGSLEPNPYVVNFGATTISQVVSHPYGGLENTYFDDVMFQTAGDQAQAGRYDPRTPLRVMLPGQRNFTPLTAPFFQD